MANAKRDANRVPTLQGVSSADALTPTDVYVDPTTNRTLVDAIGTFEPGTTATATVTRVNDTASSTQLLAANTSRVGAIFHNDSTTTLFLKFGTTATTSSYTYQLLPEATMELPNPVFTGAIHGIWSANAAGAVQITELS